MPLQSKEVVTLRLILDCDCGGGLQEDGHNEAHIKRPLTLLSLPVELRLHILHYVLNFHLNSTSHTRRVGSGSIGQMLQLQSHRILEAPQFRHRSKQEINGLLPAYTTFRVNTAILRTCRTVYLDGATVLYRRKAYFAVQCGISGFGARLRNYGIHTFGPFSQDRVVQPLDTSLRKVLRCASFRPVIYFKGRSSAANAPIWISTMDHFCDLTHALWLMTRSSFARGIKFNIAISELSLPWLRPIMAQYMLPWIHENVDGISLMEIDVSQRSHQWLEELRTFQSGYDTAMAVLQHKNVVTYNNLCQSLEMLMRQATEFMNTKQYVMAEFIFERVCLQACSIVRIRTAMLVEVSSKLKDGINRICKLIAVSSYLLCELRSGSILGVQTVKPTISQPTSISPDKQTLPQASASKHSPTYGVRVAVGVKTGVTVSTGTRSRSPSVPQDDESNRPRTTRLQGDEALEHAIMDGLLALRLPCATPVPEWNIRLNTMLLDLFNRRRDRSKVLTCMSRLVQNLTSVCKDAMAKGRKNKVECLEPLVRKIVTAMEDHAKKRKTTTWDYQELVAASQEAITKLWGQRLTPKQGHTGLIWTFRWA